jgi:ketosteroid isomerase-like protein
VDDTKPFDMTLPRSCKSHEATALATAFPTRRLSSARAIGGGSTERDTGRAMSQENVEIVRDALRAFGERGLAAMADFWAADINWRAIEGAPDDVGEMQGAEALRHYFQDWIDTFDDVSNAPEELLDLGDDRVLAVQRATGRAKASGVETELRYAVVYTLRDGKIARGREYIDRATAIETVGLRE